ncbi:RGCVC family protein [Lentzea indica]|uniref:RGCVC family protein n=1 Tax=Lentzea indica TaxID=2604800 RepID=UPI001CB6DFFF
MTTSEPLTTELGDHPDVHDPCVACPHPLHEHDALGVRYCTATTVFALPRGCICR